MIFHGRYNGGATLVLSTVDEICELYQAGMTEARRVLKPRGRLFVKGMDQVESGRVRWFSQEVPAIAKGLGMEMLQLYILVPTAPPHFKRWKRQIHARQSHSYLWVFELTPPRRRAAGVLGW
jgi:hypothetical protein